MDNEELKPEVETEGQEHELDNFDALWNDDDEFVPSNEPDAQPEAKEDEGKEKTATMITADDADINLENNLITLTGNVDIDDQSSRITCKEMEIVLNGDKEDAPEDAAGTKAGEEEENMFGNRSVSKVLCKGDVVYLERAKPDDPAARQDPRLPHRAGRPRRL